ncbi:MAG: phosphodiester glycosidase family protein [Capsulimonadaceae bacterium]
MLTPITYRRATAFAAVAIVLAYPSTPVPAAGSPTALATAATEPASTSADGSSTASPNTQQAPTPANMPVSTQAQPSATGTTSMSPAGPAAPADTPAMEPQPARPPSSFNPLFVVYGEMRLDGEPAGQLDTSAGRFDIQACCWSLDHGGRMWLPGPRTKTILVDSKTQLYAFGSPSAQIALRSTDQQPYHVTVIGDDQGRGKPLLARVVYVQRANCAEAAFLKRRSSPSTPAAPDIRTSRLIVQTLGHNFPVDLVQVKLDTVRIQVGLAWNHVGATESLGGIVRDNGALAAINGTYFDAYSPSETKRPDNELISRGDAVCRENIGTVIGFTPDGEARMALSPIADTLHSLDPARPEQWILANTDQALFWQRVTEALGAGPRLVCDGNIDLNPFEEGFRSAEVLDGSSLRSAVGITSSGWLLLVATRGTIPELAHIMRALGAAQAMNLDGGSSSGLWVRGRYLRQPGRSLSNALLVLPR